MGSALRILLSLVLVLTIGLSAADAAARWTGRSATYPEANADPSTKMSRAPAGACGSTSCSNRPISSPMHHFAYRRGVSHKTCSTPRRSILPISPPR